MMGMKSIRFLGALWALLAFGLVVFAQPITKEQKAEVLKGVEEIILNRAFVPGVDFKKWPEFIAKQQESIDQSETIAAFTTAVNRALREFGLSHISLRTPRAAAARNQTTAVGVGITVREEEEGLRVRVIQEQGPAKDLDLKPGDLIIEIDGKPAKSAGDLEGDEGTQIKIKVRKEAGDVKELTLQRQRFSTVRPETLSWLDDDTAVLRIYTFSAGYSASNIEKLMIEASKAKYLIVDLRNNGGGASTNLHHLLCLLLPDDTAYGSFVSRRLADRYVQSTKKEANDVVAIAEWNPNKLRTRKRSIEPFKGKIAVLTNRGSASASEIVAAALKECSEAVIVGQSTAGAVLASTFGRLAHGFQLQYPVSDYVTIKGVRLEKNPLKPDAEVTRLSPGQEDAAVARAANLLKSKS